MASKLRTQAETHLSGVGYRIEGPEKGIVPGEIRLQTAEVSIAGTGVRQVVLYLVPEFLEGGVV